MKLSVFDSENLPVHPHTYEKYLFNESFHLLSQPCPDKLTFHSLENELFVARLSVFLENQKAFSPYRGTFGSVEIAKSLSDKNLYFFLTEIEKILQKKGIKEIFIKHYPFCYAPENSERITVCLLDSGYEVSQTDLNQHLIISEQAFENRLHTSEKRRLNKTIKAGFIFDIWERPDLQEVYDFIRQARERKGFPISLTFADFERLFVLFPEQHLVFTVRQAEKLAALTVCIRINEKILYNFYPADQADFLAFSPSVLLTQGIYDYCQQKNFQILDLGISTDKSVPNEGLLRFKKNLGAETSLKLSFYKKIL
ncbi:MAG: hypothetical protein H7Y04_07785 [Verrucomicrobia bacterium]|nr:hypothetical protein [Cytophagales bacterium]